MASISKLTNGKWRARWRDDAGKQNARHFDRKVDAQRWLNEMTASVVRGDYVDPKSGKVTVAEYAATWQAVRAWKPLASSTTPCGVTRWKRIWADAAQQTEVSFTSHALRHFFASALISGGASVKQVQTVLGHASAVITLKVYSHLWPGDEDRVRAVMDAALNPLEDYVTTPATSIT